MHQTSHTCLKLLEKRQQSITLLDVGARNGVSAEICRLVVERDPGALKSPVVTMGMEPAPCPTAKALEDIYYPNLSTLTDAIAKLVTGNAGHGLPLPDEQSMADVYKRFKGPF